MKKYSKQIAGRVRKDIREFGAVCMVIIVYMAVFTIFFGTSCPIRLFTGLPCPGCGITRAAILLLAGRWQQAWDMNPVIFPVALAAFYYGINRYFLGRRAKEMKWIILGISAMLVAVYVMRMSRYFPDRVPYSYLNGNVLERIVPAYREILRTLTETAKRISQS